MTDENKVPKEINGTNTEKKTNTRKRRNYNKKQGGTLAAKTTEVVVENVEVKQTTRTRKTRNTRNAQKQNIFKKANIKIIPLGGLHEVGKNITVFEYENEIIVVDCGISFPEDDMLGVDLVIPDVTYLIKNQEKIK